MKIGYIVSFTIIATLLSGCAMQQQTLEEQQTHAELQKLKHRMHRNELAILAVNKKVDALKSLVTGPGGTGSN